MIVGRSKVSTNEEIDNSIPYCHEDNAVLTVLITQFCTARDHSFA